MNEILKKRTKTIIILEPYMLIPIRIRKAFNRKSRYVLFVIFSSSAVDWSFELFFFLHLICFFLPWMLNF